MYVEITKSQHHENCEPTKTLHTRQLFCRSNRGSANYEIKKKDWINMHMCIHYEPLVDLGGGGGCTGGCDHSYI